ncbi:MAG TPA: PilZ domain-containing protein [Steroidobacteraceae bacterium]
MYEGVDTVVLYDELAFHDVLPVQWKPLSRPLDRFELIGLDESNLLLLHACVAVEEHPARDKNEDLGPLAGELARLDFKLNLVLQLLAKLISQERIATPTTVQFNALGASWTALGATPSLGESGLLRVQLRSSVPQPLELPGEVSAVDGATVRVKFPELSEGTAQLIHKLAFLRHRRDIADARKAREA